MIYEYPAVFYTDGDKIAFHFYDMEHLHSFGDNLDEAILAAQELLADFYLGDQKALPATPIEQVEVLPLQVVKMIQADTQTYADELNRQSIEQAANPIRELLSRRNMKIKELSDLLGAPYRTVQDWSLGKSNPPPWVLNLILDKVL